MQAATLAGLKGVSTISDGAATALAFASTLPLNATKKFLVVDSGHSKTCMHVVGYQSDNSSRTIILDESLCTNTLSGRNIDLSLAKVLLQKASVSRAWTDLAPLSQKKLLKAANKLKAKLTSNQEFEVAVLCPAFYF